MSENELAVRFFDRAIELLALVRDEEAEPISRAAELVADRVAAGGRVFAYGAGHSALAAQDLVYRAGGLAVVNLLPVPGAVGVEAPATLGSALERVDGLATAVLDHSPARAGDVLIVISLSGRNALPVEMARHAGESGLHVIGVTSLAYAVDTTSRHSSGTFLKDHCDVVLDNHVPVGDTVLTSPDIPAPFAPASTVVISALLQAVIAAAAGELAARGVEPPLLRSGNVDGGTEWNERVLAENADRVFYRR
ncbi:SIS domain-containing protein [Streptomyces alkaliterrae]|uniref:SIS domain-containing protein n=1 Tax=Streptomyces alkaliterrae TaxID=2213162 RepID=A0A5P0YVW3_9ACTN|nr:SIS domain-containing protein [Streptomyces alkaliterrae]MBB1261680.1 SIS domain-containing protein [Streptomyces alkaliterrae]MQS04120.1 sugar isomerase domain-containing protein [Streptomyces alkaliterrae]